MVPFKLPVDCDGLRLHAADCAQHKYGAVKDPQGALHLEQVVGEALVARRVGSGRVVMVGRDIGTVILPEADLKIYLDASAEVRAKRRYDENVSLGKPADYEAILANVEDKITGAFYPVVTVLVLGALVILSPISKMIYQFEPQTLPVNAVRWLK